MTPHTDPQAEPRSTETRTVLPKERARQGVTGHNVRYVLALSLAAIIIVFAAIYVSYFGV
jgi:hypothetical protein